VALNLRKHPARQSLLAYAENLVDNSEAIDQVLASHVVACAQCKAEVQAIQSSFSFVSSAPSLEPVAELTARILMAGQSERSEERQRTTPFRLVLRVAQTGACAAAMLVVVGVTFSVFLGSSETEVATPSFERAVPVLTTQGRSPEAIRRATTELAAEVQTLSAAVSDRKLSGQSPEVQEQLRVIQSRDADIAAAVSALERNPGSVRATHVVHATLEQQAESLRSIYVEGGSL
jgi:hypothetical protein